MVYIASQERGASLDQVHLLGGIAGWPGAPRLLERLLARPVSIPDPLAVFPGRSRPDALEAPGSGVALALAAGFALRGAADDG